MICFYIHFWAGVDDRFFLLQVRAPGDFPEGGIVCSLLCGDVLKCGHLCQMPCRYQCQHSRLCQVIVQTKLACGHDCRIACCNQNNPPVCRVILSSTLPCGHICQIPCYNQSKMHPVCQIIVQTTLPCGHDCQVACCDQGNPSVCQVIVQIRLPCGHVFRLMCGKVEDLKKSKCPSKYPCISRVSCCSIF